MKSWAFSDRSTKLNLYSGGLASRYQSAPPESLGAESLKEEPVSVPISPTQKKIIKMHAKALATLRWVWAFISSSFCVPDARMPSGLTGWENRWGPTLLELEFSRWAMIEGKHMNHWGHFEGRRLGRKEFTWSRVWQFRVMCVNLALLPAFLMGELRMFFYVFKCWG